MSGLTLAVAALVLWEMARTFGNFVNGEEDAGRSNALVRIAGLASLGFGLVAIAAAISALGQVP